MAYQIIGLIFTALGLLLSFYVIINRQNSAFKAEINARLDALTNKIEVADKSSAVGFQKVSGQFDYMALQINTILQQDIAELRARLNKLESGQDDWSKELRDRSHELRAIVDKHGYELKGLGRELDVLKVKCKDLNGDK